jgi:hypothetical protein
MDHSITNKIIARKIKRRTQMKHLYIIILAALVSASSVNAETHLFILSGQSNMARLKPEISFTPAVVAEFGKDNVIVVRHAVGGQPIRRWYKNWKPGKGEYSEEKKGFGGLYDSLMKGVNKKIKGKDISTVTFVWMQGENDAKGHGDVYGASLKGLLAQLSEDMKRKDINFVIGRLSDARMENEDWMMIRKVQVEIAEADPRGAWVNTDDLNDGNISKKGVLVINDLHYSSEGYVTLGKRFAEKAIELIKK